MKEPAHMPEFKHLDTKHVPSNKRPYQVRDSRCFIKVVDYNGTGPNPEAWTTIELEESYTPAEGTRQQVRNISIVLRPKERRQLLDMLLANNSFVNGGAA